MGQEESGLDKLVKASYKLLSLSTFFTSGSDECRAWTFHNGMLAPECAGIIHSDFEKGFIKAEVYSFEDFENAAKGFPMKEGDLPLGQKVEVAVKEAGKVRSEGKTYPMKDGDIVFFRFNVSK